MNISDFCLSLLCSWVNNFGHEGLGLLLEALERLLDKKQWVICYHIPSVLHFVSFQDGNLIKMFFFDFF